jgi:GTPase SAR1 family protein
VFVPTVFEAYCSNFTVDGGEIEALLWDTGGQGDYDRLRPLHYPNTDIFCICFAIDSCSSLENVLEKVRCVIPRIPPIYLAQLVDETGLSNYSGQSSGL